MKSSEIQVGEVYAVQKYGSESPAKVLAVGEYQTRQYRGNWDYRGTEVTRKGVQVQAVIQYGERAGELSTSEHAIEWVRPQAITRVWADAVDSMQRQRDAEQLGTDAARALKDALEIAGIKYAHPFFKRDTYQVTLSLSVTEARKLAELLAD